MSKITLTATDVTVGDCTDHAWNLREAAVDYAVALGAKEVGIIIDNGADRVLWLETLARRFGPHWSSDNFGDCRHLDDGGSVTVELAYLYQQRRTGKVTLPARQGYDSLHWSRVAETLRARDKKIGTDLLIVATNRLPSDLIRGRAKHMLAVGVVPQPDWICNAAIFPGISAHAAEPIVLRHLGEWWSPAHIAAQLRGIANQFDPTA